MSRVVVMGVPLVGHTLPTLSLVKGLVANGEHVIYYSYDQFKGEVESTGAEYRRYRDDTLSEAAALRTVSPKQTYLWLQGMRRILQNEVASVKREQPDYLLNDMLAFWGTHLARMLKWPSIAIVTTFANSQEVYERYRRPGERHTVRQILGNALMPLKFRLEYRKIHKMSGYRGNPYPSARGNAGLVLVTTSDYFQPMAHTFDDRHKFIGPLTVERDKNDEHLDMGEFKSNRPLIYVSMGTYLGPEMTMLELCFDALQDVDCNVLISTGRALPAELLQHHPQNFVIREWVPQLQVLQHCAAFVTHAGLNSVSESLYHGVPVVAIPRGIDQPLVAQRVAELGAGIQIERQDLSADNLRKAVQSVLSDSRYQEEATRIGESFRAAGGTGHAVELIQGFKATEGIA